MSQELSARVQAPPRRTKVKGRRGIYVRTHEGRPRYEITFLDAGGKRRWKTIEGGLREADAALEEARVRRRRGEQVVPSKARFGEVATAWLDSQAQLRPRTREAYRWALDKHLLPRFESRRLADITEDDAAQLIADMTAKGYAGATIQNVLLPLSRVFAHAARRGLVTTNPVDRLERGERPRKARGRMRCLCREEIGALLGAASEPGLRTLLALSVSTGLRQGEALGLRWCDVDLAAGVLHVRYQLGRDQKLAEPKTQEAQREVDLAPSLVGMLREHKLRSQHAEPADPVFCSTDGAPLHYRSLANRFHATRSRAKLNGEGRPSVRWHDLRHTAASLLIAEGLNVVYVSRQLGHSDAAITLRVYAHLFDRERHAERARSAIDAVLGASSEGAPEAELAALSDVSEFRRAEEA